MRSVRDRKGGGMNRRDFLTGLAATIGLSAIEPVRKIWAVGRNAPVGGGIFAEYSGARFYTGVDYAHGVSTSVTMRVNPDGVRMIDDVLHRPYVAAGPIKGKRMDVIVCDDIIEDPTDDGNYYIHLPPARQSRGELDLPLFGRPR